MRSMDMANILAPSHRRGQLFLFNPTRVFLMCICLIGCVWQVYEVNELYGRYPMSTFVTSNVPTLVQAPAITICFHWASILSIKKTSHKFPAFNRINAIRNISEQMRVETLHNFVYKNQKYIFQELAIRDINSLTAVSKEVIYSTF